MNNTCSVSLVLAVLVAGPVFAQDVPPKDDRAIRQPDLVEVATLNPAIHLDVPFASLVLRVPAGVKR